VTSSDVVATPRLRIRTWDDHDAPALSQLTQSQDVVRFLGGRAWLLDDAMGMIAIWREIDNSLGVTTWALEDGDGALVGYCGFARTNADYLRPDTIEIGWLLGRPHWGRGLATEAARAVLPLALDRFDARRIVSKCHIDNRASERVMQRLGMVKAGVVHRLADHTLLYRLP
jgi:RimJ/RimL family protein N-acetyltransferase